MTHQRSSLLSDFFLFLAMLLLLACDHSTREHQQTTSPTAGSGDAGYETGVIRLAGVD